MWSPLNPKSTQPLTATNKPPLPFIFIGDEAFPLKRNLLRPYPGRINRAEPMAVYNYRLSREQRIVENSFGILTARLTPSSSYLHAHAILKIPIVGSEYSEGQLLQSQKEKLFTPGQLLHFATIWESQNLQSFVHQDLLMVKMVLVTRSLVTGEVMTIYSTCCPDVSWWGRRKQAGRNMELLYTEL